MENRQLADNEIHSELIKLKPWHMAIQLTRETTTATPFTGQRVLSAEKNDGVGLVDLKAHFMNPIERIFPNGLSGKRFLDCACNAGGYCFWAKEKGVDETFGFDVRSHWIDQAEFVKRTRNVAPTDNMRFVECDLYDLPKLDLPKFDITMFKGLFYHLPEPVLGLKIAAEMTRELFWFNSVYRTNQPDGFLEPVFESTKSVMSGVHHLAWLPTGPNAIGVILQWLGFKDIRLVYASSKFTARPNRGRMEILAARDPNLLKPIAHMTKRLEFSYGKKADNLGESPEFEPPWIMAPTENWLKRLLRKKPK